MGKDKRPLVSVIVRTKDRPTLLKNAIKSISNQTYRPIEVVLVNDGGCDLDIEELRDILGDISLNYIKLEKNAGRAHAGNVGIESAGGKHIGFLDDDDEYYPEHVSVLVDYLEQGDLKIAYTDSLMVYKEYNPQTQEIKNVKEEMVYSQDFDYDTLIFENYIPFMCLLFDRDVLINSGGLDSGFEVYEDYDLLIRLGEKHQFHHIKKTTADYNQWCSTSQISQINKTDNLLRESYLRLFSKHIDKFTPERIYNYRAKKYALIMDRDSHIKDLEALLRDKDAHIINLEARLRDREDLEALVRDKDKLIRDKDNHIRNLQDVIKGKDQYIASIVSEFRQKDQHITSLETMVKDKDAALNNIYNSHGWKALLVYYSVRDKILPPDSLRRNLVKSVLHFLLLLPKYLTKKKTEPVEEGRFIYKIETDLSRPFIIGAGNALYLRGWCYHTSKRIKKLYILVDGLKYPVSNLSFVRHDIFQEHFKKIDKKGHSLNSGFWVMIPFTRIDSQRQVSLDFHAELNDGEICNSSIGTLTLEPSIKKYKLDDFINNESTKAPLIAICMTTYNPSIEHFKKQIDSIINQTYTDWVCIINDDCSETEIFEKIKDIVSLDKRFKLYRNSSNLGFYHNFERCLSYVPEEASFVALSDQDDYWHEDKLSTLVSSVDNDTALVYSDMNIVSEKGDLIHNTYWTTRKNNFKNLDLLIIANTITGGASLFRRELIDFLLPFPEMIEDSYHDHFIACIALAMGKIKYVDRPLYDYYQHPGNIIGHCAPVHSSKTEGIYFFKRIVAGRIKDYIRSIRDKLKSYHKVYFSHYIRRVLIANVLNLRCSNIPAKKRKIIKRFVSLECSLYGMIFQVLKDKILRKSLITIGVDSLILKSALSNKFLNTYYKSPLVRIFQNIRG